MCEKDSGKSKELNKFWNWSYGYFTNCRMWYQGEPEGAITRMLAVTFIVATLTKKYHRLRNQIRLWEGSKQHELEIWLFNRPYIVASYPFLYPDSSYKFSALESLRISPEPHYKLSSHPIFCSGLNDLFLIWRTHLPISHSWVVNKLHRCKHLLLHTNGCHLF